MYTISKAPHLILRAPRGHLFCRTTTFSWCNDTIARENVASILQRTFRGEKHFFQANEGKVIPFIITPLIVFVTKSHEMNFGCFRVVSTSITQISYKSLSVLRFRSTFSIFFFRGADRILPQNVVEDMTCASVDCPCLFVMVKHNTQYLCARTVAYTLHVMIIREQGRFPFRQNFRNFRFGGKWNTFRRFVPLENSQKKWKIEKGGPVFPVGISERNVVFHLRFS